MADSSTMTAERSAMVELTLRIPDELDAQLRSHLAEKGGDVSSYVNAALRRQLLWDTVDAVRARNVGDDPSKIEADVAVALSEVRADRP
jgi:hypothetical protein